MNIAKYLSASQIAGLTALSIFAGAFTAPAQANIPPQDEILTGTVFSLQAEPKSREEVSAEKLYAGCAGIFAKIAAGKKTGEDDAEDITACMKVIADEVDDLYADNIRHIKDGSRFAEAEPDAAAVMQQHVGVRCGAETGLTQGLDEYLEQGDPIAFTTDYFILDVGQCLQALHDMTHQPVFHTDESDEPVYLSQESYNKIPDLNHAWNDTIVSYAMSLRGHVVDVPQDLEYLKQVGAVPPMLRR